MDAGSRLVLYGNSLFLAGIKTELERLTSLELITVEAGCPEASVLIDSCNPRAVLFDLAAPHSAFAIALLRERPGLLLIGIDPSRDEMLVLSSRPQQALNVADLVEFIQQQGHGDQVRGA